MPARTGKGRQAKGRSYERSIIQYLWKFWNMTPPWKPHARPDGGYKPPPPLNNWLLEIKRQDRLNIWAALEQAKADAGKENFPAVIFSRPGTPDYVAMELDDWLMLLDYVWGEHMECHPNGGVRSR